MALATLTCSYIVAGTGGFLAGATRHDDDEAIRRGERMGRVGFDSRTFFPWMAGHPCLTLRARPLSLEGDPAWSHPGPPVVPGGLWIGLGSRTLEERVGHWGGPATVRSLLCVAETRATWPNGEWGSSIVLAANAGPRVPSGGVTLKRRCTYRP